MGGGAPRQDRGKRGRTEGRKGGTREGGIEGG